MTTESESVSPAITVSTSASRTATSEQMVTGFAPIGAPVKVTTVPVGTASGMCAETLTDAARLANRRER